MDLNLSDAQMAALRRAALNSEYQLLLGAGASRDTLSRSKQKLPGSYRLAELLSAEFDVPLEKDDLLWRIYARATTKAGETRVYDYLRELFYNTNPPDWMDKYARFIWDRVWTLNLDDSFEKSYERSRSETSRLITARSWDDDFVNDRSLSVIHLHGMVDTIKPRKLVFSLSEYFDSSVSRAGWPLAFRDVYGTKPFIIVGARLRDEPDIEAVIARRSPMHAAPSVYVSPHISVGMREDLNSWGLIPAEGTAEDFIGLWASLTGVNLLEPPSSREEVTLRLGRQFAELRADKSDKLPVKHDFIGGDPPRWGDIISGKHADLDWIREGANIAKHWGSKYPSCTALIYVGPRLSGRSTGLLALCRVLCSSGWRVFIYKADERPDVDALLQFAADGKALAIAFDGVADFADDVDRLLREARAAGLNIVCVAVDSFWKSSGIAGHMDASRLTGGSTRNIKRWLTSTDAGRLVDRLDKLSRLGILERRADNQRLNHFRKRELFPAMAEVENAPAFGLRVNALVDEITDPAVLRLCLFASAAEKVERPLLVIDAARMVSLNSDELLRMLKAPPASALLSSDGHRVLTRQRFMALEAIVAKMGSATAMSALAEGLRALASRVTKAAHRERNATVMLVGALMTYRNLRELFPHQLLEPWYAALQNDFGWNGRYWEQRAINSRHLGAHASGALARAESFAERAVSLLQDAYSYTTLGTVLSARAAEVGAELVARYYDRAYDAFEMAERLDRTNLVTWFAYLRYALPILNSLGTEQERNSDLFERIADDWEFVYADLAPSAAKSDLTIRDLANLRAQYDQILFANREPPEVADVISSEIDVDGTLY